MILNVRTLGDGIENKAFFEEGLFGCKLSYGNSHIVRHCYDVVGSILNKHCLPLSDNWRASWRVIGRSITLLLLLLPDVAAAICCRALITWFCVNLLVGLIFFLR